ncbi:MAG: hypothetical protein JW896_18875 [Deltaproteobacteria bacterium]|nr:hypothetical protein [Deltaproteobacteria bacterium]
MAENRIEGKEPLWILIEKQIQEYSDEAFFEANRMETARKIAGELDQTGYNVSKSGGNWLRLRAALEARDRVGRSFMRDFDQAISALGLDNIKDTYSTAMRIICDLGKDWKAFLASEHRADVDEIVADRKTNLMIAKAKDLSGEPGIRYLLSESFEPQVIMEVLGISEQEYNTVRTKVDAELAERARVQGIFAKLENASEEDRIKRLLKENVTEALIMELGGIEQSAIDEVKKAMEKELAEQKRREEELAAKKAAEAAGPSLDDIAPDDMLTYIEGIREILEFSDVEKDIRVMCEQSAIPKTLVDIAISDPDKLDELEKKAEGSS